VTPGQYIAAARDLIILAAIGWLVYMVYHAGQNSVTIKDVARIEANIAAAHATEDNWRKEQLDADAQKAQDLAAIRGAIAEHQQPIVVRGPAPAGAVPKAPGTAAGTHPTSGATDGGPRVSTCDVRPSVAAVELKYETALAECRAAIASWPH
jgi:hypothetical protein